MRGCLQSLVQVGVVERHDDGKAACRAGYRLTRSGRGLLGAAAILANWLRGSPQGPLQLGSPEGKSAIKALVDGWSAGVVSALAIRPLSLAELNVIIASLSYPSLGRRLSALRLLKLVKAAPGDRTSVPYATTDWLRRAVAPLAAAAAWEHRHLPAQVPPITNRDVEAAFLLTLPLLRLPVELSGTCCLAVVNGSDRLGRGAGAAATVRGGAVASCAARLGESPDAWARGSTGRWLSAVVKRDPCLLELSGEPKLVARVVEGIHDALLSPRDAHGRSASCDPDADMAY
jgi:DNA-binding HxlR family transcriptional regulator